MKPVRLYLDEAIDQGAAKNDSDIARRLKVTRAAVSDWRNGRRAPEDDAAIELAHLLGKPEGEILAECAAARAKNPTTRAAWERIAKMASMTTAYGSIFGVNLLLTHTDANSAPLLDFIARSIGIMLSWKACINRTWRRRPRTDPTIAAPDAVTFRTVCPQ